MTKDPMDIQIDFVIQSLRQSNLLKEHDDVNLSEKAHAEQLRAAVKAGLVRFRAISIRSLIRFRY